MAGFNGQQGPALGAAIPGICPGISGEWPLGAHERAQARSLALGGCSPMQASGPAGSNAGDRAGVSCD